MSPAWGLLKFSPKQSSLHLMPHFLIAFANNSYFCIRIQTISLVNLPYSNFGSCCCMPDVHTNLIKIITKLR